MKRSKNQKLVRFLVFTSWSGDFHNWTDSFSVFMTPVPYLAPGWTSSTDQFCRVFKTTLFSGSLNITHIITLRSHSNRSWAPLSEPLKSCFLLTLIFFFSWFYDYQSKIANILQRHIYSNIKKKKLYNHLISLYY